MADIKDAPIQDPLIEFGDQKINDNAFGKARLTWTLFFQRLISGDIGQSFTPTYSGLTTSGTPTITGVYYKNQGFIDFFIRIVPGTSTTATTGTTYFQLPFDVTIDGPCSTILNLQSASGAVDSSTNRVYPYGWTATSSPVTVYGRVKVA